MPALSTSVLRQNMMLSLAGSQRTVKQKVQLSMARTDLKQEWDFARMRKLSLLIIHIGATRKCRQAQNLLWRSAACPSKLFKKLTHRTRFGEWVFCGTAFIWTAGSGLKKRRRKRWVRWWSRLRPLRWRRSNSWQGPYAAVQFRSR